MPIEKVIPTTLANKGRHYVVVPSDSLQEITNSDAVAIWAYLLDKPATWIPRRTDIMNRFSLGRTRYDKAITELKALGLVWMEVEKNELGQIVTRHLCVTGDLRSENRQLGPETLRSENPHLGESDHLDKTELLNKKDSIGADWFPREDLVKRAVKLGYLADNPEYRIKEFADYWAHKGNQRTQKGWDQTFLNYLKKFCSTPGVTNGKRNSTDLIADNFQSAYAERG